jgi:hypothetical protein
MRLQGVVSKVFGDATDVRFTVSKVFGDAWGHADVFLGGVFCSPATRPGRRQQTTRSGYCGFRTVALPVAAFGKREVQLEDGQGQEGWEEGPEIAIDSEVAPPINLGRYRELGSRQELRVFIL